MAPYMKTISSAVAIHWRGKLTLDLRWYCMSMISVVAMEMY
jgi:hypothetical protein